MRLLPSRALVAEWMLTFDVTQRYALVFNVLDIYNNFALSIRPPGRCLTIQHLCYHFALDGDFSWNLECSLVGRDQRNRLRKNVRRDATDDTRLTVLSSMVVQP